MSTAASAAGALAAQLLRCEQTLLDPIVRKDRAGIAELLAEDFVEIGASGRVWTRDETLDLLASEEFDPPVIEEFVCRQIVEDVALVTYCGVRTNAKTGERSITLRSSLWSKVSGAWRLRFHQGTRTL